MIMKRQAFDRWTLRWIALAMVLTIGSELAFSSYISLYGPANVIGHILKLAAYGSVLIVILRNMLTKLERELEERRRVEAALEQSEEQLRQSQKMEAIGQLAGGIAHDFNNLLTIIMGYSDFLLVDDNRRLSDVRSEIDAHARRRRAGQWSDQTDPCLLAQTDAQALGDVAQPHHRHHGATPAPHPRRGHRPTLPRSARSRRDRGRRQPVRAGDHEPRRQCPRRDARGGYLTLETANVELDEAYCAVHAEATPGSYVRLAVTDTGVGMDDTTRQRVFEPFFTTKPPGSGTGLGLATVYGIVKQSNGSITLYSEPGRGTTFKIYLPRVEATAAAPSVETPQAAQAANAGQPAWPRDHPRRGGRSPGALPAATCARRSRLPGADRLQRRRALQMTAGNGRHLDLLLTDLVLPGEVQGDELASLLVKDRPGLAVLYVSGYTRHAVIHAGRLASGVNLLEKPFTQESLAAAVREALRRMAA